MDSGYDGPVESETYTPAFMKVSMFRQFNYISLLM